MPKKNEVKSITGWLGLFIFTLVLNIIFTFISGNEDLSFILAEPTFTHFTKIWMFTLDGLSIFGLIVFIIYTIYSLSTFKPNAVALAKMTLVMIFIINLIISFFYAGAESEIPKAVTSSSIFGGGFVYCFIWFLYLLFSEQVRNNYPPEKRRIYTIDKISFFSILAFPIILFLLTVTGFFYYESPTETPELQIQTKRILAENELTDGRIYFIPPPGWYVNKSYYDIYPFFKITKDDEMTLVVLSDAGNYNPEEYLNENFQVAFEQIKGDLEVDYEIWEESKGVTADYTGYTKAILIHGEEEFIFGMTFLFDTKSDKLAGISYFTPKRTFMSSEKAKNKVINSLKFS